MFYTRVPVPAGLDHSEELLNKATLYFPLIGWLVGGVAAGTYWAASWLFPPAVAVLLSMVASVLLTGAFHEDGLADVCDGFGGGWTAARILEIMKDSRVGTYGLVGLGLALALKFATLHALPPARVPVALLAAHPLSRLTALGLVRWLPYARLNDADGKAKPVAKHLGAGELLAAAAFGVAPLLAAVLYLQKPLWLLVLPLLTLLQWRLGCWFRRWVGGYTGDCLGATQQVAEVLIYLVLLAGR